MSADDGGVDLDQPFDVAGRVGVGLDLLQGLGEHPVEGVAAEAGVHGLPRPVAFRQVTPGDPGSRG
jgi:hypothetical protein